MLRKYLPYNTTFPLACLASSRAKAARRAPAIGSVRAAATITSRGAPLASSAPFLDPPMLLSSIKMRTVNLDQALQETLAHLADLEDAETRADLEDRRDGARENTIKMIGYAHVATSRTSPSASFVTIAVHQSLSLPLMDPFVALDSSR